MMRYFTRRNTFLILPAVGLSIWYYFVLPEALFKTAYSTVLRASSGALLSAAVASDGQWRFPARTAVPEKFEKALLAFEDKRFHSHPGVDVRAMARAVRQNFSNGRIVSGGSTITMQVIRLAYAGRSRNLWNKGREMILATRLEWRHSKNEILALYAAHAPFGGNVVGLEAACWRYFGHDPEDLSWGEAALLAVLPNNPSLIHLNRNRDALLRKRNRLLLKLNREGVVDDLTYRAALDEPLPEGTRAFPQEAPHLLSRVMKEGRAGQVIHSTLQQDLQARVTEMVDSYGEKTSGNQIFNAAVLVMEVKSGAVLAYVGNTHSGAAHQEAVDMIRSRRSTGSILKPFLFAALQDEGTLIPGMLQEDIPLLINGYEPKNFSRQYDGLVPAGEALVRSLNIPAVQQLRNYRYEKFHHLLQLMGMSTLDKDPDHYGLSLVLGGAEGTLWDITGMYASASRTLLNYFDAPGSRRYRKNDFHSPVYTTAPPEDVSDLASTFLLSAASVWTTWEVLTNMYRPGETTGWQQFQSARPVAWKTGTSFGFRDAWAVGVTPEYAVGVWVGNADGEGRPGLTGTELAAPLLFRVFGALPGGSWFSKPEAALKRITVCRRSGFVAGALCVERDTTMVVSAGAQSAPCPFHKVIHLSADKRYRVHQDCALAGEPVQATWFVAPAVPEYYFRRNTPDYRPLPPYRTGCMDPAAISSMELLYPRVDGKVFLPVQLSGREAGMVAKATHRNENTTVYWHLDGTYLGATRGVHERVIVPSPGLHRLTLVDESGVILERDFRVISGR